MAFSGCVEREREIILVNRTGLPQHGKGEYVTHKPIIILCKVWLKHFLSEGGVGGVFGRRLEWVLDGWGGGGGGRCGADRGRLPLAGTVEWGERFGVDRVRRA